jgi:hypothetical protein
MPSKARNKIVGRLLVAMRFLRDTPLAENQGSLS